MFVRLCVYSIHVRCDEALICDLPPDQGDLDGVVFFFGGFLDKDVRHGWQVWDCCAPCDMTGKHTPLLSHASNTHTHTHC